MKKFSKSLKFNYFATIFIGLSALLLFTFIYGSLQKETYEVKLFQISPEAIRSIKTVEDTEKTELERERAAMEVTPVYQFSEDIVKNRQAIATDIFDHLINTKKQIVAEEITLDQATKYMREKLNSLEKEEPELQLNDEAVKLLLAEDVNVLGKIQKFIVNAIGDELSKPVRSEDLSSVKNELERQIRLSNLVSTKIDQPIIMIARSLIVETEIVNEALTEARIVKEKAAVEPTRILQGQVIVREGQVIDSEVYRQLEVAGLLQDRSSVKPIMGLALFVVFISSIIFMHFYSWKARP